jgi:hypothetical protein
MAQLLVVLMIVMAAIGYVIQRGAIKDMVISIITNTTMAVIATRNALSKLF